MSPRWSQKGALETLRKTLKNVPPGRKQERPGRSQDGPKMTPKIGPRGAQNWVPFWTHFWCHFGGCFWADVECHLGPKTSPGEVWRSLREPWSSERPKRRQSKKWFSHRTVCIFSLLRPPRWPQEAQKTAKERREGAQKPKKRAPNASLKKNCFWDHFWDLFGNHFGAKIEAKTRPETEPIFETGRL